jgi:DNA (cytosine-5)-methyltransferase 1
MEVVKNQVETTAKSRFLMKLIGDAAGLVDKRFGFKAALHQEDQLRSMAGSHREAVVWQWLHVLAAGEPSRQGFGVAQAQAARPRPLARKREEQQGFGLRSPEDLWRWLLADGRLLGCATEHDVRRRLAELLAAFGSQCVEELVGPVRPEPSFRFIDLFAGIGGMRLGFESAGGRCVFSSEWDPAAQQTYLNNHADLPFGDITAIDPAAIPDHDVLVAGFPCQPFSHAGLKRGIEDTRGTLFYDIARIAEVKRPSVLFLENVRGLIGHDEGRTFMVILQSLQSVGYRSAIDPLLVWQGDVAGIRREAKKHRIVRQSVEFGVPQLRPRAYIVLHRCSAAQNSDSIFVPPFRFTPPPATVTDTGSLRALDYLTRFGESGYPIHKYLISPKLQEGHERRRAANAKAGKGFGFCAIDETSSHTSTISARYYKDGSEILIRMPGGRLRKLTPREAARLQTFPEVFRIAASDVQAYKQFGNSVTVRVIAAYARAIADQLPLMGLFGEESK